MQIPPIPDDAGNLSAAILYADSGLYLLPVEPGTKHPGSRVGNRWQDKSSRDQETLISWYAGCDDGIALDIGRSGLVVVDVDKPTLMPPWLTDALEVAGAPYQSTRPDTPGRGHHIFTQPPDRRIGCGKGQLSGMGLDIKGHGGVIILQPTVHPAGGQYRWIGCGDIPELPAQIADKLSDGTDNDSAATETEISEFIKGSTGRSRISAMDTWPTKFRAEVAQGNSRHDAMVSILTAALAEARAEYYPARDITDMLGECFVDAMVEPGERVSDGRVLSETAARAEFRGILAWSVGQAKATPIATIRAKVENNLAGSFGLGPVTQTPPVGAENPAAVHTAPAMTPVHTAPAMTPTGTSPVMSDYGRVRLTPMSSIRSGVPTWAWTYDGLGRIQRGTLGILAGRPGAGKSNAARWFAAGYSTGTISGCWYGLPVNVAYISPGEESHAYVIKPGLDAIGADTGRIVFPTISDDDGNPTRLMSAAHRDLLIEAFRANGIRVVIVDPIMSTIPGTTNINQNNETRQHVEPWAQIAEAIDGIVLGVCHFTKFPGTDLVAAINGSSAFGEVARSIFGFVKDRKTGQRVMSQVKNSTGVEDLSLLYEISTAHVPTDLGGEASVAAFSVLGRSALTAADVLEAGAEGELDIGGPGFAAQWLNEYLTANGQTPAKKVIRDAKNDEDISRATLYRAMKELGVVSFRHGYPCSAYWRLHTIEDEADAV